MAKELPSHVEGLRSFLLQDSEKNEDLALTYFRNIFGKDFRRQSDEGTCGADGYVPGHFVLELKGSTNDWYSALFQGIAYRNKGLSFSLVVVAANKFIAIWKVEDLPSEILEEISKDKSAPSKIGKKIASKFAKKKNNILKKAEWYRPEMFDPLFVDKTSHFNDVIKSFEKTLKEKKKVRQTITPKNFVKVLEEMKTFFDPKQPIKTVRAFYSMIYGPWDEESLLSISQRYDDRATLGSEDITNLVPHKRDKFKDFVENYSVSLGDNESLDDFFAKYDEALDAVDKKFRVKHGIFFTDLDLSKFVMWVVKQQIPTLGKNYLVIDPACGSGNLVTNWRSPLELRHKVVSEIEPELLYAVEQRMKGDQWHNGKFTVVPKVSENKGLNFLDKSAVEYIDILTDYLKEKGQKADKPLAFLCNPPYRSDDDQGAESISYQVHSDIVDMVGADASSERYCCFLAQMKLICAAAAESGMPEESVLLLFTQTSWLTNRPIFKKIRKEIFGSFEDVGSIIVNSKEFFDVGGTFPIAFTIWKYKGENTKLNEDRPLNIIDLTWLKKADLSSIDWNKAEEVEKKCTALLENKKSINVKFGTNLQGIQEWTGQKMSDFKRGRRLHEKDSKVASGLPTGDHRHLNKKAYGEADGTFIGFMDNLGLCRIKKDPGNFPWFRLNSPFMDVRKTRCLSGPADQKSFYAYDLESAKKVFFWYGLGRVFSSNGYPMWANQLELWPVDLTSKNGVKAIEYSFMIGLVENECIETRFPAGNPIKHATEIISHNPMSPLNPNTFWNSTMNDLVESSDIESVKKLLKSTKKLFSTWKDLFKNKKELIASYEKAYFVGTGKLTTGAGILQIRDFGVETNNQLLNSLYEEVQKDLKILKDEYYEFVVSAKGLSYFDQKSSVAMPQKVTIVKSTLSKFEATLEKRKALTGMIIQDQADKNLGIVKLAKVIYLLDKECELDLESNYIKDVAGPVDNRMLYNEKIGIFPNGKSSLIGSIVETSIVKKGKKITFKKVENTAQTSNWNEKAKILFSEKMSALNRLMKLLKPLSTDHAEVVATVYACWNDLLISKKEVNEEEILKNFYKWNRSKLRFEKKEILKTFEWMKAKKLIPKGRGKKTLDKRSDLDNAVPF